MLILVVVLLISSHFASEYEACKCYLKKHRSHKSCQQKRCDGPRLVLLVAYHSYRFLIVHHLPFVTAFNRPPLPRSFCFCFLPDNADSNLCLCKCRCKRPYRQEPRLIPWALHSRLHLELLEPLFLLEQPEKPEEPPLQPEYPLLPVPLPLPLFNWRCAMTNLFSS